MVRRFVVRGVALCIVNSARRVILAELPTAALVPELMVILDNTTSLNNQFLSHRVSLVPLGFDENQLRLFSADEDAYVFVLIRENAPLETGMAPLTSEHFKVLDREGASVPAELRESLFPATTDGVNTPPNTYYTLLAQLKPGEKVHIRCKARTGTGGQDARWSQISLCFFRNRLDAAAVAAALAARLDAKRAAAGGELSPAQVARITREFHAMEAQQTCFKRDAHGNASEFDFEMQCETRLRPAWIFWKALRVLRQKVQDFHTNVVRSAPAASTADDDGAGAGAGAGTGAGTRVVGDGHEAQQQEARVEVVPSTHVDNFQQVLLRGEDHTLGNLLQELLYNRWVRDSGQAQVSYIGYYRPHPSEDHIILKVRCAPGVDVRELLAEGARWVVAQLDEVAADWIKFTGLNKMGIHEVDDALLNAGAAA